MVSEKDAAKLMTVMGAVTARKMRLPKETS